MYWINFYNNKLVCIHHQTTFTYLKFDKPIRLIKLKIHNIEMQFENTFSYQYIKSNVMKQHLVSSVFFIIFSHLSNWVLFFYRKCLLEKCIIKTPISSLFLTQLFISFSFIKILFKFIWLFLSGWLLDSNHQKLGYFLYLQFFYYF